jgi:hypothetical protein
VIRVLSAFALDARDEAAAPVAAEALLDLALTALAEEVAVAVGEPGRLAGVPVDYRALRRLTAGGVD